jgi:hypothetical protein
MIYNTEIEESQFSLAHAWTENSVPQFWKIFLSFAAVTYI